MCVCVPLHNYSLILLMTDFSSINVSLTFQTACFTAVLMSLLITSFGWFDTLLP